MNLWRSKVRRNSRAKIPMSSITSSRHTVVTIDRIESALRVVAKRVEENPAYLPLFERLIEEREAMIRKRKSLELVKQWAS